MKSNMIAFMMRGSALGNCDIIQTRECEQRHGPSQRVVFRALGVITVRIYRPSAAGFCADPPGALREPLRGASGVTNVNRKQWALQAHCLLTLELCEV